MPSGRLALLIVACLVPTGPMSLAAEPPWGRGRATPEPGDDRRGRRLRGEVVLDSAPAVRRAPSGQPDGSSLVVTNGGGRLLAAADDGRRARADRDGLVPLIDINHGISPDGKTLAFSAGGALFRTPASGGAPARVTAAVPSYFHAWSPDGKALAYAANRGGGYDIYTIAPGGGPERRLTVDPKPDDAPAYSPDGRWIYYSPTDAPATATSWRMPALRRRPGRRRGRADHLRRPRRRGAPSLARRQVADLPLRTRPGPAAM